MIRLTTDAAFDGMVDAQLFGRTRKAAGFAQGEEDFRLPPVHARLRIIVQELAFRRWRRCEQMMPLAACSHHAPRRSMDCGLAPSNMADQRARCITDNVRIIKTLIQAHRAVGILPEYVCGDMLADQRFKATPLPRRRDVWLLVQNHLKRDRAARVVIDWIRQCFLGVARR